MSSKAITGGQTMGVGDLAVFKPIRVVALNTFDSSPINCCR